MSNPKVEIDENKHVAAPTIGQKLKNTVFAIFFGVILVQIILLYRSAKSGSFTPSSVIRYFDSFFFIGYLVICGILGWFAGQNFIDWLKVKISSWKFW